MSSPPSPRSKARAPRAQPESITPAVLRFSDGRRVAGELQVVSVTGGLLGLPRPLDRGSVVKLMFLTRAGSVFGAAEMLPPVSWVQQPFRFGTLHHDDQSRLQVAVQGWLTQSRRDHSQSRRGHEQVEKHRAW